MIDVTTQTWKEVAKFCQDKKRWARAKIETPTPSDDVDIAFMRGVIWFARLVEELPMKEIDYDG